MQHFVYYIYLFILCVRNITNQYTNLHLKGRNLATSDFSWG